LFPAVIFSHIFFATSQGETTNMADEVYDGAIGIDLGKKLCMQDLF
jgi:hypothetical protein